MTKKILLIGAGNIGFRHFQGLLASKHDLEINIFDKYKECYNKFNEHLIKNKTKKKIIFLNKLKKIKKIKKIDLLVLSTNSKERLRILKKITSITKIRNILFEKIVFNDNSSFLEALKINKKYKIRSWVNCVRREVPIYQELKKKIGLNNITISYKGDNWGMASNTIHFIDLFYFLKKIKKKITVTSNIKKVILSKRKNYNELLGSIDLIDEDGNRLFLEDLKKNKKNELLIQFKNQKYIINQNGVIYKKNNFAIKKKRSNENVSKITKIFTDKLFSGENIKLTTLKSSQLYHQIFFKIVNEFKKKNNLKKIYFT